MDALFRRILLPNLGISLGNPWPKAAFWPTNVTDRLSDSEPFQGNKVPGNAVESLSLEAFSKVIVRYPSLSAFDPLLSAALVPS